jgi:hypothetical protein
LVVDVCERRGGCTVFIVAVGRGGTVLGPIGVNVARGRNMDATGAFRRGGGGGRTGGSPGLEIIDADAGL